MQSYQCFQCIGHTVFNTSGTNAPCSLSLPKAGTHSVFRERSRTSAYTPKHGAFWVGALLLPSDCFTRFGTPAWSGGKTAYFAPLRSGSRVLPKNAKSLRDSDALMCVAVPRRRGPAGLRDLFSFLSKLRFSHPALKAFCVCEGGGITTLGVLCVLLKRRTAACQKGSFAAF